MNASELFKKYCEFNGMDADEIHGKPLDYWKENAEDDYVTTPISVLKYIIVLEEYAQAHKEPQSIEQAVKKLAKKSTALDKETSDWLESDIRRGIIWGIEYAQLQGK